MFKTILKKLSGIWKSLTIWFNGAGLAILQIAAADPEFKAWVLDHNLFAVWIIGNILLRFKTSSDLADK